MPQPDAVDLYVITESRKKRSREIVECAEALYMLHDDKEMRSVHLGAHLLTSKQVKLAALLPGCNFECIIILTV